MGGEVLETWVRAEKRKKVMMGKQPDTCGLIKGLQIFWTYIEALRYENYNIKIAIYNLKSLKFNLQI